MTCNEIMFVSTLSERRKIQTSTRTKGFGARFRDGFGDMGRWDLGEGGGVIVVGGM